MMDFYEGWNLYQRLMRDGYLPSNYTIEDGTDMDLKIEELARQHYNWTAKEPEHIELNSEYRESLEQQTASDRLHHIWEIAIDYDGYRTYRYLGRIMDEIIACSQVKVKDDEAVLNEMRIFKQYNNAASFMEHHCSVCPVPFRYSFPAEDWKNVESWCEENGYDAKFLGFNSAKDGHVLAVALKISKKEDGDNAAIQEQEKEVP